MFTPGAQIRLAESSITNGTGPRKGSLGYFIDIGNHVVIEDDGMTCCALALDVVFKRFGFEKKFRREHKRVIALFPAEQITSDAGNLLLKLQRYMTSPKYKDWRERIRANWPGGKTPLVIAVPANASTDLLRCSKVEYSSWAESVLRNQALSAYMNEGLVIGHLASNPFFAKNSNNIQTIRNMSSDRDYREYMLSEVMGGEGPMSREELTTLLRMLVASKAGSRKNHVKGNINISVECEEYIICRNFRACLVNALFKALFDPQKYNATIAAFKDNIPSSKYKGTVRDVAALRDTILGLS
jgi:hypothetical protein